MIPAIVNANKPSDSSGQCASSVALPLPSASPPKDFDLRAFFDYLELDSDEILGFNYLGYAGEPLATVKMEYVREAKFKPLRWERHMRRDIKYRAENNL